MNTRELPTFGETLRRYRVHAGYSQEQLAERSGLAAHGISQLERGARTKPHYDTVRLLADGLGLDQRGLAELLAARNGIPVYSSPSASQPPSPMNSFIGRVTELVHIRNLLLREDVRLVTLTGPGGVGKTRIAIRLAQELEFRFVSGVIYVSLAEIIDVTGVLPAIAAVLGVSPQPSVDIADALSTALEQSHLLLVLDNLEHMITCAPAIECLLMNCPYLTILVTSRRALRLDVEQVVRVEPMDMDDAVRLFAARIHAADVMSPPNPAIDAVIVRKLEGLPLSIELAAARVRMLTRSGMLEQLDAQLPLLIKGAIDSPARHRTIRDTIAWSYGLLSSEAQRMLRWLAAFPSGCSCETATALFGDDLASIALTELEESSLINHRHDTDGMVRYTMLQTVREYAHEVLQQTGEETAARNAIHDVWATPLAKRAEFWIWGADAPKISRLLALEYPNLQWHIRWLIASERIDEALVISGAITSWRMNVGRYEEARQEIEHLLRHPRGSAETRGRVSALIGLGLTHSHQGEMANSVATLRQAAELALSLGERRYISMATMTQHTGLLVMGDREGAEMCVREGLAIAREDVDSVQVAFCTGSLATLAMKRRSWDEARQYLYESLALHIGNGTQWGIAQSHIQLTRLYILQAETDAAEQHAHAALTHMELIADRRDLPAVYRLLADIAVRREQRAQALTWLTSALEVAQEIGSMSEMAYVQLKLAVVDHAQAPEHYAEAIHWFTRCGDVDGLEACRAGLAQLTLS